MKTRYHVVSMFVLLSVTSLLQAGVTNVLLGCIYQCCLDTGKNIRVAIQDAIDIEVAKQNDRRAQAETAARAHAIAQSVKQDPRLAAKKSN